MTEQTALDLISAINALNVNFNQSSSLLLGSVTTLLFGLALSICIRR